MCCFCKASTCTQRKQTQSVLGRRVIEIFISVMGMCVGMGGWVVGVDVAAFLNQNSNFLPLLFKMSSTLHGKRLSIN